MRKIAENVSMTDKVRTENLVGGSIRHISIQSGLIETLGFEPQRALLEVKLSGDGNVWQYWYVPVVVWYQFWLDRHRDAYFRRYICGRYRESLLADEGGSRCTEMKS